MKKIITTIICCSIICSIAAQITLTDAIDMAKQNNKDIQMAHQDVEIARYNYNDIRGQLFPQVSLVSQYSISENTLPKSIAPNMKKEESSLIAGIQMQQLLFSGGKLINGLRVLDKVKTLQEKKYQLETQNMILSVIQSYYDLYLAQEAFEIQNQALQNAERHLQRVENLYTQGIVAEYDLLRAQLEVARLHPELLSYENMKNLALENFNRITGNTEEVTLNTQIEQKTNQYTTFDISLDEALDTAQENRIELYLIRLAAEMYQVQYDAEKGNFLPNVVLQADITRYNQSDYTIHRNDFGTIASVGIALQMPLFTGLSNSSKTNRAAHELRKAQYDIENTTELINLEIRQNWQAFYQSIKALETQETNIALAQRALQIAQARFENQFGIQLEVFDAQIQYNAAQIALAQARISIIKDYYTLNKSIGNDLENITGEM